MNTNKFYFFLLTANMMVFSLVVLVYLTFVKTSMVVEVYISTFMMLSVSMVVDLVSMTFMFTVLLISSMVMMYSVDYMKDESINKFMLTMIMFISFMVILCLSGNLLWVMIGWDGLGVSSFALIMYFQNWKSFNSSMVTFMCNRVGDLFILSSIAWLMANSSVVSWLSDVPWFIQLMILITALSKSAQLPFSSWLPLAMAAPTPVSSLVHSSTLVTAGVFLMIRFSSMLETSTLTILTIISSCTVVLAGVSSIWEFDFKKIIALSTLSHIGLMMMMISISDEWPAIFHLVTHSMFKSLLFMVAGSTIHSIGNIQDIRAINSISYSNHILMVVSIMSMMGLPFLSGFYSKEMMMMSILSFSTSLFFLVSFLLAVMLTCIYSIRLLMYLMSGKTHSYWLNYGEGEMMKRPMILGCLLSCSVGSMVMWDLMTVGECSINFHYSPVAMKELLVIFMLIGTILGSKMMMIPVGKYTTMMSSMLFIGSFCFLIQGFMMRSSFNLMSLDIKGWADYCLSFNSKEGLNSLKDLLSSLMNQPIWLNNMMIMICMLMMIFNIIIVSI